MYVHAKRELNQRRLSAGNALCSKHVWRVRTHINWGRAANTFDSHLRLERVALQTFRVHLDWAPWLREEGRIEERVSCTRKHRGESEHVCSTACFSCQIDVSFFCSYMCHICQIWVSFLSKIKGERSTCRMDIRAFLTASWTKPECICPCETWELAYSTPRCQLLSVGRQDRCQLVSLPIFCVPFAT